MLGDVAWPGNRSGGTHLENDGCTGSVRGIHRVAS